MHNFLMTDEDFIQEMQDQLNDELVLGYYDDYTYDDISPIDVDYSN